MSRVLILLLVWLLLSVPVALLLGRALRHGRTAAVPTDADGGPRAAEAASRRGAASNGNYAVESPVSLQPRLALVDPGTGRSRSRPGEPLGRS